MDNYTYNIERRSGMYNQYHWYPRCPRAYVLVQLIGRGKRKTITENEIRHLAGIGIMPVDVTPNGLDTILDANNHEK